MLRLRTVEGAPRIKDVAPRRKLQLISPRGEAREVTILDHSVIGGRQTQERLDRTRELDIVISAEDAGTDGDRIDIGWFAAGPRTG